MTLSRRMAAVFRAVLVAGLVLPFGAVAEENLGWHFAAHDGRATLYYGIPQSGYGKLSFSCQTGSDAVSFVFAFAPIQAVDGVKVTVVLETGDISLPVPTTGAHLQMDDQFLLEGEIPLDVRLADLLTSRETLLVFVEDGAAEYPLDGAQDEATALIEACESGAGMATTATCEFDAWVQGDGPGAMVIRDGPTSDAAVIADMPGPYPGYDGTAYPTVSVTGARDGWFRIEKAVTNLYAPYDDVIVAFAGEGWVSGKALRLYVESSLYASPANNAAVALDFNGGVDSFLVVDRLYACRGRWVEVGGTYAGGRVRGWSADTCESQITTCP